MKIKQFRYSSDNLAYLIYNKKQALAIDPGAVNGILEFIKDNNLNLEFIANTHSHFDHTCGNSEIMQLTEAKYLDISFLKKTQIISLDGEEIRILSTPGHTADSICFYFDNYLISGDTLFNGKVGRCFTNDIRCFYESIKKIMALPKGTLIYAGHDYFYEYIEFVRLLEPDNKFIAQYKNKYNANNVFTTLEDELMGNPFLRLKDDKIISILAKKNLPNKTEYECWVSLIKIM